MKLNLQTAWLLDHRTGFEPNNRNASSKINVFVGVVVVVVVVVVL